MLSLKFCCDFHLEKSKVEKHLLRIFLLKEQVSQFSARRMLAWLTCEGGTPFVISVTRQRLEACCKVAVYLHLLSCKLLTFGPKVSLKSPKLFIQEYLCQRF